MSKQSAVEWLIEQIKSDQNQKALSGSEWIEIFEQAKQMEKQQIAQAWEDGDYNYFYNKKKGIIFNDGLEYFNEKYG